MTGFPAPPQSVIYAQCEADLCPCILHYWVTVPAMTKLINKGTFGTLIKCFIDGFRHLIYGLQQIFTRSTIKTTEKDVKYVPN